MPRNVIIVGLLIVVSVALVTYYPSLKMGFRFTDDYIYLHWAGSMALPEYLAHAFDPRLQSINYRPLRRVLLLFEYGLFHSEASYYHLVQVLIHLANSLLVLGVVWRLSKRWRVAFLAAILFAGLALTNEAVFWITDESPLATFFSLAATLFWVNYLQNKASPNYLLAIGALILALLTKESAAVVPIAFFLVDRMLIRDRVGLPDLVRRYLLVAVVLTVYLAIEYTIQRQGIFLTDFGYSLGEHVLYNYAAYLAMLVLPWRDPHPPNDSALWLVWFAFVGIAILKRSAVLTLLALLAILTLGPFVAFPLGASTRFLYSIVILQAILWALVFEALVVQWNSGWVKLIAVITLACLVILNGSNTADAAAFMSEITRQYRVPFRDIMQQHPAFPNDTRLFFIERPYNLNIPDIAGMFFLRYGTRVSVSGTYEDGRPYAGGRLGAEKARLRDYTTAYVYYFDEANRPVEVAVDSEAKTQAVPELPSDFAVPIRLEGYEITSSRLRKGQPLVLILYWRALGRIERDYTVFVHLIDSDGRLIVGEDNMPRDGEERTSAWQLNQFTADGHVIPIPSDVPVGGDYQLEVGMYWLPKVERVPVIDQNGQPITDKMIIGPIQVIE